MAVCLLYIYDYHGYDFTPPISMLCILLTFMSSFHWTISIFHPSLLEIIQSSTFMKNMYVHYFIFNGTCNSCFFNDKPLCISSTIKIQLIDILCMNYHHFYWSTLVNIVDWMLYRLCVTLQIDNIIVLW